MRPPPAAPLSAHAPEDLVFIDAAKAVHARELAQRALAVREALEGLAGPYVVVACADRLHFAAAMLGAWSLGLQVWLPHNTQPEAVESLSTRQGVRALLHDCDAETGMDVRALGVAEGMLPPLSLSSDRVVAVVHTSGSTGEPVAHEKTWGQLGGETAGLIERFGLAGRSVVATVPPHHIYGLLFGVLVPLCGGGRVGRSSPLLPRDVADRLCSSAADVLVSVPAQLRAMIASDIPLGASVFSSGAPLPRATAKRLRAGGARVIEVLGSTETGGMACRSETDAVWRCMPGVSMHVLADGQLAVDSPWLHPDAPRPFPCADRVEAVGPGAFLHLGRVDRVVKLGGRRVDLGAVETALAAVDGVRACRVAAVEVSTSLRGVELLAAVEADDLSAEQLRDALCRKLDPVTVPRRYRVVPLLPRTAAGKVTDATVRALFEAEKEQSGSFSLDELREPEAPSGEAGKVST